MSITPIDIRVKEYMRQFLQMRMDKEKMQSGLHASGFVLRQSELEKFLDDAWVHINSKLLADQNNEGNK